MQEEFDSLYKELVVDCGRREKDFYFIRDYQWDYCRQLSDISRTDTPLRPVTEDLYQYNTAIRAANSCTYRKTIIRLTEKEDKFIVVHQPS